MPLAPLIALLIFLPAPASAPTTAEDRITIDRQPPTVEYATINHAALHDRLGDHLKSLNEDAWCQSFFNCTVKLKYEIVGQQSEPDGRVTVQAKVQRVSVVLTLSDTIYLPKPRTQKLMAHEEGHRRINERVYRETGPATTVAVGWALLALPIQLFAWRYKANLHRAAREG